MKFPAFVRVLLLGLAALVSLGAGAEPYARLSAPPVAKETSIATRAPVNYATYLQTCTMDISVQNCLNNGSLGAVYTSDSAYSALSSLGCTYMYARSPSYNKPGLDVYNCNTGSFRGSTVFVFLDGDFSNSLAWTISILY